MESPEEPTGIVPDDANVPETLDDDFNELMQSIHVFQEESVKKLNAIRSLEEQHIQKLYTSPEKVLELQNNENLQSLDKYDEGPCEDPKINSFESRKVQPVTNNYKTEKTGEENENKFDADLDTNESKEETCVETRTHKNEAETIEEENAYKIDTDTNANEGAEESRKEIRHEYQSDTNTDATEGAEETRGGIRHQYKLHADTDTTEGAEVSCGEIRQDKKGTGLIMKEAQDSIDEAMKAIHQFTEQPHEEYVDAPKVDEETGVELRVKKKSKPRLDFDVNALDRELAHLLSMTGEPKDLRNTKDEPLLQDISEAPPSTPSTTTTNLSLPKPIQALTSAKDHQHSSKQPNATHIQHTHTSSATTDQHPTNIPHTSHPQPTHRAPIVTVDTIDSQHPPPTRIQHTHTPTVTTDHQHSTNIPHTSHPQPTHTAPIVTVDTIDSQHPPLPPEITIAAPSPKLSRTEEVKGVVPNLSISLVNLSTENAASYSGPPLPVPQTEKSDVGFFVTLRTKGVKEGMRTLKRRSKISKRANIEISQPLEFRRLTGNGTEIPTEEEGKSDDGRSQTKSFAAHPRQQLRRPSDSDGKLKAKSLSNLAS